MARLPSGERIEKALSDNSGNNSPVVVIKAVIKVDMAETITLEVTRYRPEEETEPTSQSFEVPFRQDWVVLDALNYIKDKLDGSLSYRWSCRMGVCGSCGFRIANFNQPGDY